MLPLGFSEAEAASSPPPPEGLLSHPDPSAVCLLQGPPISLGRANALSPQDHADARMVAAYSTLFLHVLW